MSSIKNDDELISMMLNRIPEKYHEMIHKVVDEGISRQQLKLIEMGIHNGKNDSVLKQIREADISTNGPMSRFSTN